jgi:hypothetical protein
MASFQGIVVLTIGVPRHGRAPCLPRDLAPAREQCTGLGSKMPAAAGCLLQTLPLSCQVLDGAVGGSALLGEGCTRFVLLFPRSFQTRQMQRELFQSRKQAASKKGRLHEKSYPSNGEEQSFPSTRYTHESNGERCSGPSMRGKKREKNPTRRYDFS